MKLTPAMRKYVLHWAVKTLTDVKIEQGEVPFSISAPK